MSLSNMFSDTGIHAVVDGQFGSTGKGALSAFLADTALGLGLTNWGGTISNAGPNSGHTFYHNGEKHVLKQLPTFSVYMYLCGVHVPVYLSGGAIIDPAILKAEAERYPGLKIAVHPNAAVITDRDKAAEHSGSIAAVAGTRSGTGQALANKILRKPEAVFKHRLAGPDSTVLPFGYMPPNVYVSRVPNASEVAEKPFFLEVSQGFSLGINQSFYPKVTSRECTVAQGIADAGLPPQLVEKVYMAIRTFPIRVGNHEGFSSGDCYMGQKETTWEAIGQTPELTTVTQRVRRVFTFSEYQVVDAALSNCPDYIFLNFMNYLDEEGQREMLETMDRIEKQLPFNFELLQGFGPKVEDVKW